MKAPSWKSALTKTWDFKSTQLSKKNSLRLINLPSLIRKMKSTFQWARPYARTVNFQSFLKTPRR
jgi:hypothetical protein